MAIRFSRVRRTLLAQRVDTMLCIIRIRIATPVCAMVRNDTVNARLRNSFSLYEMHADCEGGTPVAISRGITCGE